jgi:protein O-GlcNAc transferase
MTTGDLSQAIALYREGKLDAAVAALRVLADRLPQDPQLLFYLGTAELKKGDASQAARRLERSLQLAANPNTANNLGLALLDLGQNERALNALEQAVRLSPRYADAHYNRGTALQALGRLDEALQSYEEAIRLQPDHVNAHNNRGVVLRMLQRAEEALACFDTALRLRPDSFEAHTNRGNALCDLRRPAEALPCYERALQLKPEYAEAHNNRGAALSDLGRLDEAVRSYERAIRLKSDYGEAFGNLAKALSDCGRLDEALLNYGRAIELTAGSGSRTGEWLYTKLSMCDWSDFAGAAERVTGAIEAGRSVASPFLSLVVSGSAPLQRQAAEQWVSEQYPGDRRRVRSVAHGREDRVRLAYFSADFRPHAVMHLIAELFERHDRSRFEVIGFSTGRPVEDEWRQRAVSSFDRFYDVHDMRDEAAAELARSLRLDIAVDLNGFTQDGRLGVFAEGCAPIQVSYLGYPGTTGAPFIDYIVADRTVIPEVERLHYTEKVAYLPDCFLASRRDVDVAPVPGCRADCGLPEEAFVFCCFNGPYKIVPGVFDRWMQILRRVEGSVLWMAESNPWAMANLRAEAQRRGINPDRLVFAKRLPKIEEHLGRIRHADLFLDTLPYNAHTTASDALRMGVPLLTQIGSTFAGRVAASLLLTLGLDELVAESAQAYEDLAVSLATAPERLSAIRSRLIEAAARSPLYDSSLFARQIERLYEAMYERYRQGLPPEHIGL